MSLFRSVIATTNLPTEPHQQWQSTVELKKKEKRRYILLPPLMLPLLLCWFCFQFGSVRPLRTLSFPRVVPPTPLSCHWRRPHRRCRWPTDPRLFHSPSSSSSSQPWMVVGRAFGAVGAYIAAEAAVVVFRRGKGWEMGGGRASDTKGMGNPSAFFFV